MSFVVEFITSESKRFSQLCGFTTKVKGLWLGALASHQLSLVVCMAAPPESDNMSYHSSEPF